MKFYWIEFSQKWKSVKCSKQKDSLHQLQFINETEQHFKPNLEHSLSFTLKQNSTGFSKYPG
jgi:hypothetical protein